MNHTVSRFAVVLPVIAALLAPAISNASTFNSVAVETDVPFAAQESSEWLLIGAGNGGFGTTVSVNTGFELGAHLPLDGAVPTNGGGITETGV